MKLFAIIFAIFISLLTIQPAIRLLMGSDNCEEVCSDGCCESDGICSDNSNFHTKSFKNCCPIGICNPFQSCTCCPGGIVRRVSLVLVISSVKTNHNQPNQSNPVLGFRSDCYHPPEVAGFLFDSWNSLPNFYAENYCIKY